ncbi:MAG TPA: hypothetical protein VFH44_08360 [Solirubrobacterales bacterium]|nr:hypothetical protein [Solirubrobacterales bacterium]
MRGFIAACVCATLVLATAPALANPDTSSRTERVHRYYVGAFDGLPQSRIAIARFGGASFSHINYLVRMKCKGKNARINSGFEDLDTNDFKDRDSLGGLRGAEWIEGGVTGERGAGTLRAHFRGRKHDPHARRCDTGRVAWSVERVTYRRYRHVLRHDLGVIRK